MEAPSLFFACLQKRESFSAGIKQRLGIVPIPYDARCLGWFFKLQSKKVSNP